MPAITPPPPERTTFVASADTSTSRDGILVMVEIRLREAGRGLEFLGMSDPEADRMGRVLLRLASRVRTDRLAAAA